MPSCKYCGQTLWGGYITALGATWHPEHFLCASCKRPLLEPEFQVVDGQPYHPACYAANLAPRCVYCHKPLLGKYLIDGWGDTYCPEHQERYPRCSFCSRLIPPQQQTPGWNAYGVTRCGICHASAIEVVEQALPWFQECKQWLGRQGFRFNQLPLHLELHDRSTLMGLLQGRSINHPLGVTLSSKQVHPGYVSISQVEGVAVLQGMPPTLFAGVVLHELGHVWLTVHQIEQLQPWAEEGFCQLLSYRYYQSLNTPEAHFHAKLLESASDPVYGEGFRAIRARADKLGFQRFVEILQTTRRLPAA